MRTFVYFSSKARTSGNWEDLMKAGRMDIVCHVVINSFYISNAMRDDVKLHLVFYGPPDPPKHIEISVKKEKGMPETGKETGSLDISKKDVAGLIKRILFKYREGKKTEAFPGCWVERKNLFDVLRELENEGKEIYVLDEKGEDLRGINSEELKDAVFVLGDHEGLPSKELKRMKKMYTPVSLGKVMYFASHVVAIVNYELDRLGI